MATREIRLIDAVDADDLAAVRAALAEGADANARKRVTLQADVEWNGRKEDTIECETALGRAVMSGNAGVAEALLAAGAEPNAPVEWRTAFCSWPQSAYRWGAERWSATITFKSHLMLAIGRDWATKYNGTQAYYAWRWDQSAAFCASKRGGHVTLVNPRGWDAVSDSLTITPRPALVRALLSHGATVDDAVLASARKLADPEILRILEQHRATPFRTRPALPPPGAGTADEPGPAVPAPENPLSAILADQLRRAEDAGARAAAAEARASGLQAQLDAATTRVSELQRQGEATQARAADLQAQLAATQARAAHLEERGGRLEAQLAQSGQRVTELLAELSVAQHQLSQRGTDLAPPAPPEVVNAVMNVAFDYDPRDGDEVELRAGQLVFVNVRFGDAWGKGYNVATSAAGFFPMACLANPSSPLAGAGPPALGPRTASYMRADAAGPGAPSRYVG